MLYGWRLSELLQQGKLVMALLLSLTLLVAVPPNCGGTPYTLASGTTGYFEGIRVEVADAATPQGPTSIQGNVITNINLSTSTATTTTDAMHAIAIVNGRGNVEVGEVIPGILLAQPLV